MTHPSCVPGGHQSYPGDRCEKPARRQTGGSRRPTGRRVGHTARGLGGSWGALALLALTANTGSFALRRGETASLFAGQELFQVMLADQPAAPCFHRPELAGAQQVMD
jgi:hypothetical protein